MSLLCANEDTYVEKEERRNILKYISLYQKLFFLPYGLPWKYFSICAL